MENEKSFKPDDQSICKLFSDTEAIFAVPDFQRQYSWGDSELEALWSDFTDAYEDDSNQDYFLGSVVVVMDKKRHLQEVVDGQQRITTLMIMLNVLYRTYPNLNASDDPNDWHSVRQSTLRNLIYYNGEENRRLQLQVRRNYDSIFEGTITDCEDFSQVKKPQRADLRKEDPKYKFQNTAWFFYEKFRDFVEKNGEAELGKFVNYILYQVYVIKIICYNQAFAIKLFLILNDRGKDLTSADIIKSYILSACGDDEHTAEVFESNWRDVERICNENDVKMDEFLAFYEYYKLESYPKTQITEDLKPVIMRGDVKKLANEILQYSKSMETVFNASGLKDDKLALVYSLRYLPWRVHVVSALTTAEMVNYPQKWELYASLRRFYYLCWIAGKTLNGIKQTSFNIIKAIQNREKLTEIQKKMEAFIKEKQLVHYAYEALEGDVYGEDFLKPLMLSIEYVKRDRENREFYQINKNLHMDHILAKEFNKLPKEWPGIEKDKLLPYLNTIGNMALLSGVKNHTALNYGIDKKLKIYKGEDHNDDARGRVPFETTNWVINDWENGDYDDIDDASEVAIKRIENRKKKLMETIESLLEISK